MQIKEDDSSKSNLSSVSLESKAKEIKNNRKASGFENQRLRRRSITSTNIDLLKQKTRQIGKQVNRLPTSKYSLKYIKKKSMKDKEAEIMNQLKMMGLAGKEKESTHSK